MSQYLFIESRDPFESADSASFCEIVQGVSGRGNETVLFLLQNGVLAARQGSQWSGRISGLLKAKVKILVDQFSVKERALLKLVEGIETSEMSQFVRLLLEPGTKAIWH